MEFPLSQAPEMFFDEQLWQIFISYFETPEIALERLGYPPMITGYHHEHYETRSSLTKEVWQEIEEAHAVGRELLLGLQRKFLNEELTATGGAVWNAVGIRCGAFSGNMKVSFHAARSIG
jgi:hypothetical protein